MFPRILVYLLVFPLLVLVSAALGQQVKGPIVGKAERFDTSKPLRELAEDAKKEEQKRQELADKDPAQKAIRDLLKAKHPAALQHGELAPLADDVAQKAVPKTAFFTLRFRQWPVAFEVPEGLSPGNLCVVQGDKVTLISEAGGLEKFLGQSLPASMNEADQRQAAAAWLRLSQELHQDGFYKFKPIDVKGIVVEPGAEKGATARGKTEVEPTGGNQGDISVSLTFDGKGKLTKASEKAALKAGVRPICQATKLLDADPLVRRMAERDLLVLGSLAQPYLIEQRRKAVPELQRAMDGVWERIVEEGR